MSFKMKYAIEKKYLPVKTARRAGIPMTGGKPTFGVLHDTGNPSSTALGNVNYYINSANAVQASAQTFVDHERIIECIPVTTGKPEKAWHVLYNVMTDNRMFGDDANDVAVGIELCYGPGINMKEAYKRYIWYAAYCAYKFGFSPKRFAGHNVLDPARKVDPMNAMKLLGKSYNELLQDIVDEYADCTASKVSAPKPTATTPAKSVIATATVLVSELNVRQSPSLSAKVVRVLPKGRVEDVYGVSGNFVKLKDGYASNADGKYLKVVNKPKTKKHKIVVNDTLWSVSKKYKTTVSKLVALNPKLDPNKLTIGDYIIVPV